MVVGVGEPKTEKTAPTSSPGSEAETRHSIEGLLRPQRGSFFPSLSLEKPWGSECVPPGEGQPRGYSAPGAQGRGGRGPGSQRGHTRGPHNRDRDGAQPAARGGWGAKRQRLSWARARNRGAC